MIPALVRFARELRREGLETSPAEMLDAARALDAVGPERRDRVRAALRTTLVKDRRHLGAFDRAFDRFFASPGIPGRNRRGKAGAAGAGDDRRMRSAREDGTGRGRRERPRDRKDPGLEARSVHAANELSRRLQAERERPGRRFGRLRHLAEERSGRNRPPRSDPPAHPGRIELTRRLTVEDESRLAREIPRLIRRIRLRAGRRRYGASRGRPWPQRVFRRNLAHGGVPFVIPCHRRRPRRSRVVLLVDVSWSTASAAGYFLWLAASFLDPGRRTTVLSFVDRPIDITFPLRRWLAGRVGPPSHVAARLPGRGIRPAGPSFADLLQAVPDLDLNAPSDYGRVFYSLSRSGPSWYGKDTVLLVLGDGRCNRFDPLPWAFRDLARRCRSVLWLVPEDRRRWGTGDSALDRFLPEVDVAVEARDLDALAAGVSELVRRL